MLHVHHVDNTQALLWAMHMSNNVKSGGIDMDYAELMTILHMTPEHKTDANKFVTALRSKNIVFRHQRGHTEEDDKHIGSILNRAADSECTKKQT